MCFSFLVERNLSKYKLDFGASVDKEAWDLLEERRLLSIHRKRQEVERREKEAEQQKLERELRKKERRVSRKSGSEPTKEVDHKKKTSIGKKRAPSIPSFESPSRIFPGLYSPVVHRDKTGQYVVTPMRYNAYLSPNAPRTMTRYNVRRDNISADWWKKAFRIGHGFVSVLSFRESVPVAKLVEAGDVSLKEIEQWFADDRAMKIRKNPAYKPSEGMKKPILERSIRIDFTPKDKSRLPLLIPAIFSTTVLDDGSIDYGFAIVTDDPVQSVERTGHDRTAIVLERYAVDEWSDFSRKSFDDLDDTLATGLELEYNHALQGHIEWFELLKKSLRSPMAYSGILSGIKGKAPELVK